MMYGRFLMKKAAQQTIEYPIKILNLSPNCDQFVQFKVCFLTNHFL